MKKLLFILCIISTFQLNAQKDSTLSYWDRKETVEVEIGPKPSLFNSIWVPVGMSLISVDLMRDSAKYGLQEILRSPVPDTFRVHTDDYIQYAPIAIMYMADLFKVPSTNTTWNQTKFLIFSELGTAAIVHSMKYAFGIQRPNNGSFNAYPSGHTSQAFVASQVLFNEYRYTNKWIACSGFLFSVPTGYLRILNNKHWLPDVLMGAGAAILVTNLVYYFEPLKNWNPFNKNKDRNVDVGFVPSIRDDYFGGHISITF